MTNIILCGGIGSRLWPFSRMRLPKQFARILPGHSLFEATVLRNAKLGMDILVASNVDQHFLAVNQLRGLGIERFSSLIEPEGRNTAPAVALACMGLDANERVLVTPSDHAIEDEDAYCRVVERAGVLADDGAIVTFGIVPTYPETGFGYIEVEGEVVRRFCEKPNKEAAEALLAKGNAYWNSGMLCFRAGIFLSELRKHAPAVYDLARAAYEGALSSKPLSISAESMRAIPAVSVDTSVLEKTSIAKCVICPNELGWSDLGCFDALYDHAHENGVGASYANPAPVMLDSDANLVLGSGRQIALVDVHGLIVADSPDALLVARRGSSQKVKQVFDELRKQNPAVVTAFPRVERPWGCYSVLYEDSRSKIKRIEISPGCRLSLQRHFKRDEHITVIEGTAKVLVDKAFEILGPGRSVLIPASTTHRIENGGDVVLVFIESEIGDKPDEDDIERLQDDFFKE